MWLLLNAGMSLVESGLLSPGRRRKAMELVSKLYEGGGGGLGIAALRKLGVLGTASMG